MTLTLTKKFACDTIPLSPVAASCCKDAVAAKNIKKRIMKAVTVAYAGFNSLDYGAGLREKAGMDNVTKSEKKVLKAKTKRRQFDSTKKQYILKRTADAGGAL